MNPEGHYEKTKDFFRTSAIEKQGYYNAKTGGALKHSPWIIVIRKMILKIISGILEADPDINSLSDIGCGRADFTIEIADQFTQLTDIVGTDFSEETLDIARKDIVNHPSISVQSADLLTMPFENKRFNISLCNGVLHHIHKNDLEKALSELARVTNKYLILEIKNNDNFYYRYLYKRSISEGVHVYPTSRRIVSEYMAKNQFEFYEERDILLFNWLSPMILVVYKRRN